MLRSKSKKKSSKFDIVDYWQFLEEQVLEESGPSLRKPYEVRLTGTFASIWKKEDDENKASMMMIISNDIPNCVQIARNMCEVWNNQADDPDGLEEMAESEPSNYDEDEDA